MNTAGEQYLRPASLPEALSAMATDTFMVLAGGTDIYPAHAAKPMSAAIMDISAIGGLRGISKAADGYRIGATTTWSDIARADLPPAFRALKEAATQIGAIQVQNCGTIGGNLCNASPAADGVPPLLALNAQVELASCNETRRLALDDFITGYRRTARRQDELVTAILVPTPHAETRSSFVKLGARKYLVISIVMAAAAITRNAAGAVTAARIAVGAASERAMRLIELEKDLVGLVPGQSPESILRLGHFAPLSPISDVRSTADYRRDAAWSLVAEALVAAR